MSTVPPSVGRLRPQFEKVGRAQQEAATSGQPAVEFVLRGRTAAELLAEAPEHPDWVIPNVAARGWIVKFAAREKTGKGTLIFNLIGCLERGEATVFGPSTAPLTALIYTEEPADSVREKVANAGLQSARIIYGYELNELADWKAKASYLAQVLAADGHGLLFVDNISRATGCEDEAGTELARAVEHLSDEVKTRAPHTVTVVDHHHRKAAGKLADKSRGGTALAGAVDCNIEIEHVGAWDSRVRKVSSRGRLSATIWDCQIALSEDGTRYEAVAASDEPQSADERRRLRLLTDAGSDGLTVAELMAVAEIGKTTAGRQLKEFVRNGLATVSGKPARYYAVVVNVDQPPI